MAKDRITKKDILKTELNQAEIKWFSKDSTAVLQERLDAHKEKRPFVQPPKGKAPSIGKSKLSTAASEPAAAPSGYKHSNGNIYTFRPGRTQVILRGTNYSVKEALEDPDVMDTLVERNHPGLISV